MARNGGCHAAQQVLKDRDRIEKGVGNFCPVALTGKQQQTRDGGNTTKAVKSWTELWKLKSTQPHRFAQSNSNSLLAQTLDQAKPSAPAGFAESTVHGWMLHSDRRLMLEAASYRQLWLDEAGLHHEAHEASDLSSSLLVVGAAAAQSGAQASGGAGGATPSARHVVIMDFHKAAEVFKIDLEHIERPASMLAVYGSVAGTVPAEVAARSLHEKLLRRLGSNRSKWSSQALEAALIEALTTLAHGADASAGEGASSYPLAPLASPVSAGRRCGIVASVALVLGNRVVAAAAGGAACLILEASAEVAVSLGSVAGLEPVAYAELQIEVASMEFVRPGAPCVLLATQALGAAPRAAAASQAAKGRPRAAAYALLGAVPAAAQRSSAAASSAAAVPRGPGAAAAAQLAWTGEAGPGAAAGALGAPAAKRRRTEPADERVRCRRILLKYLGCRQPTDPVRRRPVRRSLNEAASELLGVLQEIDSGGDGAFAKHCRAVSECQSSLKGGDLVGDVGWWTKPVLKPGEKASREVASKNAVINAALQLDVGEVSDILIADDGVQVLQRRA